MHGNLDVTAVYIDVSPIASVTAILWSIAIASSTAADTCRRGIFDRYLSTTDKNSTA